ncbi:MAG: cell division protein FtsZ [Maricaulaceae bacterium]
MAITLSPPGGVDLQPRIVVFGVGGAGGNAVSNMINAGLQGCEFVVANTDAQALSRSNCERKVQIGAAITEGLGAGARPDIGARAAEESIPEILEHLDGAHMAFITAGMGGGTGTGAAPIIARAAREQGVLTVGVVTKPFDFEGRRRMTVADAGIRELQAYVDTLIVIPNQNLFRIATEKTTFAEAFGMADEVLHSGVRGITDLMIMPGLINLDFADVRTVMMEMGKAMMGTGEAKGDKRAIDAAQTAIANPLLDDVSLKGAKGVLINITGGYDMTLYELDEAANEIRSQVDPDANIIVGSTFDETMEGGMRVSVVATGIAAEGVESAPERLEQVAQRPLAIRHKPQPPRREPEPKVAAKTAAASSPEPPPLKAEPATGSAEPVAPAPAEPKSDAPTAVPFSQNPLGPSPEPVTRPGASSEEREPRQHGGFLLFGRNKAKAEAARTVEPARAPVPEPSGSTARDEDLFDDIDEALDIPAFLRRQAN